MGRGRRLIALVGSAVVIGSMLTGIASAGSEATQPTLGTSYDGTAPLVEVSLAAVAPAPDGGTQLRGTVSVACSKDPAGAALTDDVRMVVEPGGTFRLDEQLSSPPEGGSSSGRVRLRGEFTDASTATVTVRYNLSGEDDDGNVFDRCRDRRRELELTAGAVDPGLALIRAAIDVEHDDEHYRGYTATSPTHVFVALRESEFNRESPSTVLLRIDPATNEIDQEGEIDGDVDALAAVGDHLFGLSSKSGELLPIDPDTLEASTPIPIVEGVDKPDLALNFPNIPLWDSIAVVDGQLWMLATRDQSVIRFDPASEQVTATVPLGSYANAIVGSPNGVYVTTDPEDENLFSVVRIDPASASVAAASQPIDYVQEITAGPTAIMANAGTLDAPQLALLDPFSLAVTAAVDRSPITPLVAASPGFWGARRRALVALDANLAPAVTVEQVLSLDGPQQASTGFGAVWVYDQSQRLVYRIATF